MNRLLKRLSTTARYRGSSGPILSEFTGASWHSPSHVRSKVIRNRTELIVRKWQLSERGPSFARCGITTKMRVGPIDHPSQSNLPDSRGNELCFFRRNIRHHHAGYVEPEIFY